MNVTLDNKGYAEYLALRKEGLSHAEAVRFIEMRDRIDAGKRYIGMLERISFS